MSSNGSSSPVARAEGFAARLGIRLPVLLAPMAGACPPSLSIAVANAGGMGACGAVLMAPDAIRSWVSEFRQSSQGAFQINLWIPDPPPVRDVERETREREFLATWGPVVAPDAGDAVLPDFAAQCEATLEVAPKVISSIMGLYPADFVRAMKSRGILWLAAVTTVEEAVAAEAAGADAIVAQGAEAGGHRGAFRAEEAEHQMVGLMALLPQVVDAVSVPAIATGGITDARGVAAALILGASAVQVGTGFLCAPESGIHPAYAAKIAQTEAHATTLTHAYTGRTARGIANSYTRARAGEDAPEPAEYPIQRGFTRAMREAAIKAGDTDRMQMWAGQAAKYAQTKPAAQIAEELWTEAVRLLS